MSKNSLGTKKNLTVGGKDFEIFDISTVEGATSLPFSLKILLEKENYSLLKLIMFRLMVVIVHLVGL